MRKELLDRSNGSCELCGSAESLMEYVVPPRSGDELSDVAVVCKDCNSQLINENELNVNHWRCLNDSMWSDVPAVKIIAYRILDTLKEHGWPLELKEMMYLDEEELKWAEALNSDNKVVHKDSNGAILSAGDTVVIIKDLNVKGSSLVAKRGTAVRNITLVHDNPEQIEGKVEGQRIVILTQYVKK